MAEIGQAPSSHELEVLALALRTRARTVSELAALSLRDENEILADLMLLESQNFLVINGVHISYREPDAVITERAGGILSATLDDASKKLTEANALIQAIPYLMQSWATGADGSQGLPAELFHGPFAPMDLWLHQATTRRMQKTDGILPDAHRIFSADRKTQRVWFDAVSDESHHVRTILSATDLAHPGALAVIEEDTAVGAEFRMMVNPPSWFWISDDVVAGIPLKWGDAWPTTVMAVYSAPVITLLRWLYDRLWSDAIPVLNVDASWDPLLELMSQGATLETASSALGFSSRTGRRRLTEAMDYFGVNGHVALGAAWREQQSFPESGTTNERPR